MADVQLPTSDHQLRCALECNSFFQVRVEKQLALLGIVIDDVNNVIPAIKGQFTAMAEGPGGETRIAYFDVDAQNLKYAAEDSPPGTWNVSVVDDDGDHPNDVDDTADVGTYADMVIDSAGVPHVTYYAHRIEHDGATVTTAMYARATSATPTGPSIPNAALIPFHFPRESSC